MANEPYVLKTALAESVIKVGDRVKFPDGTNSFSSYIILHKDNASDTVVLGRYVGGSVRWFEGFDYTDYHYYASKNKLDAYCRNFASSTVPSVARNTLVNRKLYIKGTHKEGNRWYNDSYYTEVTRTAFAPSVKELGLSHSKAIDENSDVVFEYFRTNASNKIKAITTDDFWTRTRKKDADALDDTSLVGSSKDQAVYIEDGASKLGSKDGVHGVFLCLNISARTIVSKDNSNDWWLTPDLPPNYSTSNNTAPGVTVVSGATINAVNDRDFTFSWAAATDSYTPTGEYSKADWLEGATSGVKYRISETTVNSLGQSESSSMIVSGTSYTKQFGWDEHIVSARYTITAIDEWGNPSDASQQISVNVTNNLPPFRPSVTCLTNRPCKGQSITFAFAPGTDPNEVLEGNDPDGNFNGRYRIYVGYGDGALERFGDDVLTSSLTFTTENESLLKIAVSAIDDLGAESTRASLEISLYDAVTMGLELDNGSLLKDGGSLVFGCEFEQVQNVLTGISPTLEAFESGASTGDAVPGYTADHTNTSDLIDFEFALTDTHDVGENGTHVWTAELDGVEIDGGTITGSLTVDSSISFALTEEDVVKMRSGQHEIKVTVENGETTLVETIAFTKDVEGIYLEFEVEADGVLDVPSYLLNIGGNLPEDGVYVMVCNDADQVSPSWEEASYNTNGYANFDASSHGNVFGVKIAVSKPEENAENYYISSIYGMFGKNWVKWVTDSVNELLSYHSS